MRHPVPKAITEGQKIFKAGFISFDKRQGAILISTIFLYAIGYKQLLKIVDLNSAQTAVLYVPVLLLALLLAFVRLDGRHLDWHIVHIFYAATRPKNYLWRRVPAIASNVPRVCTSDNLAFASATQSPQSETTQNTLTIPPAKPKNPKRGLRKNPKKGSKKLSGKTKKAVGGKHRSKKDLKRRKKAARKQNGWRTRMAVVRDSVQQVLPAEDIVKDMFRTKDGTYLMVLEITPINMSLVGTADIDRIFHATTSLYNRIDFPICEITSSRPGDLSAYTSSLKQNIVDNVSPREIRLAYYAREHLQFLNQMVRLYRVYDRRSYVVTPYKPERPDTKTRDKRFATAKDWENRQKETNDAHRTHWGRAGILTDSFRQMGAQARVLAGQELLELLMDQTGAADEKELRTKAALFDPVTLDVGTIATMGESRRQKNILAANKARTSNAPLSVDIGDLNVADRSAPDTVKVHDDYLKVGDRFHSTLFFYDYPPDVAFGELQQILNIPGRVKVVKYVTPLSQQKAVGALGAKVAELEASEATASDGNVIASKQRAMSRYSADEAMNQLISGQQHFFELSLYVHCEADTKRDLDELVEEVRTKINSMRATAKRARMESLEGYISCLPLATNQLTKRYARKGMLTNPLACFFVYGSYELTHPKGLLLGINPYSSALVVLDNRKLVNPHMIMMGTSGGGKTQTVKTISTRARMRGRRVVIIDPEGNSGYGRVAKKIGGQYVPFGLRSPNKFNPCDLSNDYMALSILADADEDSDPEEIKTMAKEAALDGKIASLTNLISLMVSGDDKTGGLANSEYGLVEELWYETYRKQGIFHNPETHDNTPPIMPDFFAQLKENPKLEDLYHRLHPWHSGAFSHIFNGHTNIDLDNKYLVLQIAGVNGHHKAALMFALLDFLNGKLSNPSEPSDCFIDEFWSLLKYPMAADFAETMWRSGRARNNAMIGVTQEIEEFANSERGRVMLKISASHLLLRQQKKTVEILEEFHTFSSSQKQQIVSAQQGEGYLIVQDNQIPLYVVASPHEERLFNTDPAREAEYEETERELEAQQIAAERAREEKRRRQRPTNGDSTLLREKFAREALEEQSRERVLEPEQQAVASGAQDVAQASTDPVSDPEPVTGSLQNGHHDASDEYEVSQDPGSYTIEDPATTTTRPDYLNGALLRKDPAPHPGEFSDDDSQPGTILDGQRPEPLLEPVPRPASDRGLICAAGGAESLSASAVAYNLAGISGATGRNQDISVLFVDASGELTNGPLEAPAQEQRPDALLMALEALADPDAPDKQEAQRVLTESCFHNNPSNIWVLPMPLDASLSPYVIIQQARLSFDYIFVATGTGDTNYASEWLANADVALACSANAKSGGLVDSLTAIENVRGGDDTMLVALGSLPEHTDEVLEGKEIHPLPQPTQSFLDSVTTTGALSVLTDTRIGAEYSRVAASILSPKQVLVTAADSKGE